MLAQNPHLEADRPDLLRFARHLARDNDAEDLVQQTYVRVLEERGAPVENTRAWMRQILRNEGRMRFRSAARRQQREVAASSIELEHRTQDPEHVASDREVATIVGELIACLAADVRLVVRERYLEGHTCAEIARRHCIPAGTVRWRLKTGLDQLRVALDRHYGGRRSVWTGAFFGAPIQPTLVSTAASQPTSQTSLATKGTSAMSLKIIGALTALSCIGGAVAVSSRNTASAEETSSARSFPPQSESASVAAEDARIVARGAAEAQWRQRVHDARAALEQPASDRAAQDSETLTPSATHACADEGCLTSLATQIMEMVAGCRDASVDDEMSVGIRAHVIGAPDVGTVVESVELEGETIANELDECIMQSMYTLELGATAHPFEETIEVRMEDRVPHDGIPVTSFDELDPETKAAIETALGGKTLPANGKVAVLGSLIGDSDESGALQLNLSDASGPRGEHFPSELDPELRKLVENIMQLANDSDGTRTQYMHLDLQQDAEGGEHETRVEAVWLMRETSDEEPSD